MGLLAELKSRKEKAQSLVPRKGLNPVGARNLIFLILGLVGTAPAYLQVFPASEGARGVGAGLAYL